MVFADSYKNKKVLITGNTGFKGSWLTTWLIKLGAKVYGLSNGIPTKPSAFEELGLKNKINHFVKDIRDLESVNQIVISQLQEHISHMSSSSFWSSSFASSSHCGSSHTSHSPHSSPGDEGLGTIGARR